MVSPHHSSMRAMTSGLSGSPADMISRSLPGRSRIPAWMSMRHTVGGAQNVVTSARSSCSTSA